MSRSYKRNNWTGWTCADSDKEWKQDNNRRFRRKRSECRNRVMKKDFDSIEDDEFDKIDMRMIADAWMSSKDGKQLWDVENFDPEKRKRWFNNKGKLRK